jgi:hypothetical protein
MKNSTMRGINWVSRIREKMPPAAREYVAVRPMVRINEMTYKGVCSRVGSITRGASITRGLVIENIYWNGPECHSKVVQEEHLRILGKALADLPAD